MIDYNGKQYEDHKAIYRDEDNYRHERVKESTFLARVRNGKGIKEALETPTDSRGRKKKEVKPDPIEAIKGSTSFHMLEKLKRSQARNKFKSTEKPKEAPVIDSNPVAVNDTEKPVDTLSNPLQKRVSLYLARVIIGNTERAVIGFTTEKQPYDLDMLESEFLLLSKVNLTTAGQIQQDITEHFSARVDEEKTREFASSQCFHFQGDEFYEALDYIYLLIATYQ